MWIYIYIYKHLVVYRAITAIQSTIPNHSPRMTDHCNNNTNFLVLHLTASQIARWCSLQNTPTISNQNWDKKKKAAYITTVIIIRDKLPIMVIIISDKLPIISVVYHWWLSSLPIINHGDMNQSNTLLDWYNKKKAANIIMVTWITEIRSWIETTETGPVGLLNYIICKWMVAMVSHLCSDDDCPNSRAYKGEKERGEVKGEYGEIWEVEEGNTDYGVMMQPSPQHVAPGVKGVEWILGTKDLGMLAAF